MNKRYVLIAFMMLVLAALACNRTVPTATPQSGSPVPPATKATDTPAGESPSDITPSPAEGTLAPADETATPTQGAPECVFDADFVTDVTIPDDTELEPGVEFVKTWRMRNIGTCPWEVGTAWAFDSGEQMGGPDSLNVPVTEPGETADVSVHMTAPTAPGTYTSRWRMRRPDGETFGTLVFVCIIVPGDKGTATPTASATPTAGTGAGPSVNYFGADVQEADPGDTITLMWETENAVGATLYHLLPTGQLGAYWQVDLNGDLQYDIDPAERNYTSFLLVVSDEENVTAQASLSIILHCPDTWFFTPAPDECPASLALVSDGAEEHFEHGTMIWVSDQDLIYVLFDDNQGPRWGAYGDEWDEGEPEDDPTLTPPAGLYQPIRGFGLVWRERPGVRDRLGWAVDTEQGFSTAVQRTSRPKYNDTYIRALDEATWKLLTEASGWEKITE